MIDVTLVNFEAEVITASLRAPVLVDVWAEWCGPCKQLGPQLELLETEYAGRFALAKLDADKVPEIAGQLSQMFGTRSIPLCVLFVQGQPVDGFVGALPPAQLRAFLDKHVPSEGALEAEAEVDEAHALLDAGDTQAALAKMADALAADPTNDDARFDYVRLLIGTGAYEEAQALLHEPLARIPKPLRFEALSHWLGALQFVQQDDRGNWPLEQFDAQIAQNKRDFDTRFAKARVLMAEGQWTAAMDELLEILLRDKAWQDGAARKTYVAILELLTPPKPKADAGVPGKSAGGIELMGKAGAQEDEATALLNSYRRKLSMALN
ncbi:tetratricopeptide repeat protein [Simplicispira hankyongi]|uniref:Co-chaperone YbbN n=1 Tax=Simplicispira hankyongi TaxID=2315688 RepID=A0A398C883_9BURK|nr:tetratricopeptide repeat protein [Simplicispira hankyongi]MBU6465360.1 tetratricopeptide repeat protein [Burkholderiales bacterium]RID97761.1 co-chaperone YbbN [Simplicispira hankyongi]